ncbi:hypothetical protein DXG01_003185 [Tephrocybe rancida]|nr:hypothetical protein DXG01_003185 [Tephrocybe rancida]
MNLGLLTFQIALVVFHHALITAPPDLSATQEDIRARSLASEPKREASSEANKLQKRVGCLPFNVPDGRTIAALVNNIQAWIGDNGAGPTVDQIVANDQVRQAFQLAWADTYPEPNRMRETNFFIQRVTTQLPPLVNIDPPPSSNMAINIAHPDLEPTPVPDGFVLVATFHTHPGFGPRSRAQIDPAGPQNFPMANQDIDNIAAHDFDRGRQVGSWAPACVPNQPEPPDAPSTSGCFGSGHTEL